MITSQFIAFAVACFFVAVVPGPSITVIVANSLRGTFRAGLATIIGTQFGVFTMMLVVAFSLDSIVSLMAEAFFWLKLFGAAYLVWLGISMFRANGSLVLDENAAAKPRPKSGYFWQGFLVIWSNPKALVFFGAFIPQFVSSQSDPFWQVMFLGLVFMAMTTIIDSCYAMLASKTGSLLTKQRVNLVEKISGSFLIGGGIWIATLQKQ